MKKRLLITSIVMMLVVAVALSTATYAWFTSNASVTATSITMYAATNSEASIGISWTNGNFGTSIAAVSPAEGTKFEPTAISTIQANTALSEITWASATVKQEGGVDKFNSGVVTDSAELCYTWNDGTNVGQGHTTFFIHNGSGTNQLQSITASCTITGEAANFIRVGFFVKDPTANVFKLKGVITDGDIYTSVSGTITEADVKYYSATGDLLKTSTTTDVENETPVPANSFTREAKAAAALKAAVGSVTAGGNVSAVVDTTIQTSVDLGGLTYAGYDPAEHDNIPGIDTMEIKVLVWMDGSALNDATAGVNSRNASVVLHFEADRGNYTYDTFGGN